MKNKYKLGTFVEVTANADDVFLSFRGNVVGESKGYIQVNDGHDNVWDCDEDQIEVIEDQEEELKDHTFNTKTCKCIHCGADAEDELLAPTSCE